MSDETLNGYWARQRAAVQEWLEAVELRRRRAEEIVSAYAAAVEQAEREVARRRKSIAAARSAALNELDNRHAAAAAELAQKFAAEAEELQRQFTERRQTLERKYHEARRRGQEEYKDRLWRADSLLEAGEKAAKDQLDGHRRTVAAARQRLEELRTAAESALQRVRLRWEEVEFRGVLPPPAEIEPQPRLEQALQKATAAFESFRRLPQLYIYGPLGAGLSVLLVAGLAASLALLLSSWSWPEALLAVLVVTAVAAPLGWWGLRRYARQRLARAAAQLAQQIANAERAARLLEDAATSQFTQEVLQQREKHAERRRKADEHYLPWFETQKQAFESECQRWERERQQAQADWEQRRAAAIEAEEEQYQRELSAIQQRYDAELAAAEGEYAARQQAAAAARDAAWQELAASWQQAVSEVETVFRELRAAGETFFPPWEVWRDEQRPWAESVPAGIRFGEYIIEPPLPPQGMPDDPRLEVPPDLPGALPAYIPFPERAAVLLRVRDEGRAAGVALLQSLMLRFLTALPPGKVRFTIIDPLGLGDNFAAFMHLADADERLIHGQIWTEPRQIEQRLADLTEHITSVIQKYLRKQFSSIEEYNRAAGEVAEPYRVLVVANFPAGFTPEAAQRLLRIAASGPSCGVCVLVSADTRQPMPRDFQINDLEALCFTMAWKDQQFYLKDAVLGALPVRLDAPPDAAFIAGLVRRYGVASRAAARVEVPFDFIAPPPEGIWTADASNGLSVPIGRAGATRQQVFRLGEGTAQHALVAGKTGSGKSTLLHALIANLSLLYSPDEVELYLIDFKEGVEFQWYAALRLPHARVVAIESEREFGLSVLQRLDELLRQRGELFRAAGVNDLPSYRQWRAQRLTAGQEHGQDSSQGQEQGAAERVQQVPPCPRVLLIIDEFQQLFVEDDKIAQEAALLLDRLVRQGRAFGIHVLLGSQTLGGAYSLPRSTLDQMAVRIALQCSDADAQLILNKDNTAARLLSRPGEAIYNEQGGLVEGNEPFQVVWLPEERRVRILEELRARAGERWPAPVVFAGHVHADLRNNAALWQRLESPAAVAVPWVWLGEPVAIKEPTAVPFRSQSGANLAMIGQNEAAARGLFIAACLSLAAQAGACEPPPLVLLDGTPDDDEQAELFARLGRELPALRVPMRSELPAALAELAAELDARMANGAADRRKRFLLIFGIQRLRELRKQEDEFGFVRRSGDRPATPAEHLAQLLREGPPLGIHTILWCDSLTNWQRTFERQQLRDFAYRVLFQMNPTDSSTLMDSPAASRLGPRRALLLSDESERPEKFRPYGVPETAWLVEACRHLSRRIRLPDSSVAV